MTTTERKPIFIQETFINRDKDAIFGESGVYEAFTDDRGRLYKSLVSEYGRCTGKVYRDRPSGPPQTIGWVFIKRMQYEDARTNGPESYYLREVWVTLHEAPPTKTVQYHYAEAS